VYGPASSTRPGPHTCATSRTVARLLYAMGNSASTGGADGRNHLFVEDSAVGEPIDAVREVL